MTDLRVRSRWMSFAGPVMVAALLVTALADSALAWFAAMTIAGGTVAAATLIASRRNGLGAGTLTQPDPMSRGRILGDAINFASIRVAGTGGLPLVAFAVVLALNFPKIGWTVALGLAGGVVLALGIILYRRHSGPLTTGGGAPRGRGVLFTNGDARATPRVRPDDSQLLHRALAPSSPSASPRLL
jgi:hypothetical protein